METGKPGKPDFSGVLGLSHERNRSWLQAALGPFKPYFGAEELEEPDGDMAELLLLPSAGVAGVVVLLSAGAIVEGVVAAGGAGVAGGGVVSVLLQAESTSAAAIALRANFVFIDNPQRLFENRPTE